MPSFHVGWTFLIGMATFRIAKTWWLKLVGILLPLLMLVTVIATANHFILDAIAGAVLVSLSYGLAMLFAKLIKPSERLIAPDRLIERPDL